jgi:uncharacterized protein (TIGR02246 family)
MKSLNWNVLRRSACLIILAAVAAGPSAAWSRAARPVCHVGTVVPRLLLNWADKLQQSWRANNPALIVGTYAGDAYLLPTCANGPEIGHDAITAYFRDAFLPEHPVATFNLLDPRTIRIGGDCANPFASGLYTFALGEDRKQVRARFTYVFRQTGPDSWLIAQHHSSLEPKGSGGNPKPECPAH